MRFPAAVPSLPTTTMSPSAHSLKFGAMVDGQPGTAGSVGSLPARTACFAAGSLALSKDGGAEHSWGQNTTDAAAQALPFVQ